MDYFKDFYEDFKEDRAYTMLSELGINKNTRLKSGGYFVHFQFSARRMNISTPLSSASSFMKKFVECSGVSLPIPK